MRNKEWREARLAQPHCIYCIKPLTPGQKTYCSETCREKGAARRKRLYNKHERPFKTPKPKREPIESHYLDAFAVVNRDVAIGFCRYCLKPVPFGQHRFCDATCRQRFGALKQYVDSHRVTIHGLAGGNRMGSNMVRIANRPDNEGYWLVIGRAVWRDMGEPTKIALVLQDARIYLMRGNEYTISGVKRGSLHVSVGVQRIMALGLRPIRYSVLRNDDSWYLYPAE